MGGLESARVGAEDDQVGECGWWRCAETVDGVDRSKLDLELLCGVGHRYIHTEIMF